MADLTRDDVLKLAQLVKIKISDDEIDKYQKEISTILQYVEQLKELDLTEVEPTYQVTGLTDVMRPDVVVDYGTKPDELLMNAPSIEDGHIKVRRVL